MGSKCLSSIASLKLIKEIWQRKNWMNVFAKNGIQLKGFTKEEIGF